MKTYQSYGPRARVRSSRRLLALLLVALSASLLTTSCPLLDPDTPPQAAELSITFTPASGLYQWSSANNRWEVQYSITVRESNGVDVELTSLQAGTSDYSSYITDWFGTDVVAGNGSISSEMCTYRSTRPSGDGSRTWSVGGEDTEGNHVTAQGDFWYTVAEEEDFTDGLALLESGDQTYPVLILGESGEMTAPRFGPDGELESILYYSAGGKSLVIWPDADGRPSRIALDNGAILLFANWMLSTVDIALVTSDGNYEIYRDQPLLAASSSAPPPRFFKEPILGSFVDKDWMDLVGTALSYASCAIAIATAPAHAGLGVYLACGSYILNVVSYAIPERYESLLKLPELLDTTYGVWSTLYDCTTGSKVECIVGAVSIGWTLIDSAVDAVAEAVNAADGALRTAHGDIKITLTWDTTADLDLWVTDPAGEKIYYGHPWSASGGLLDVDDTSGYGPENIYWPDNAPNGSYFVQVDHYSGASPSHFEVYVYRYGDTARYFGTVSSSQTATVVTFGTTGELP